MSTFLSDTYWVAWRELKHFVRQKVRIFMLLFQPIVWLTLMGNVFQRMATVPGFPANSYIDYMTPGIVVMVTLFGGIWGGMSTVWDRRLGFLHKMMAAPIARSALVTGKMVAIAIQTGFQVLVIFGIALIMGVKFSAGPGGVLVLVAMAMLLSFCFAGFSLAMGSMFTSHETLMAVMNFFTLPLMFTSSAMMPLQMMPDWLASIARFNPITQAISPIRALFLTGWDVQGLLSGAGLLVVIAMAVTSGATALFRRSPA